MLQKLRPNNQGFTLIELMIVIAIIGILAAIAIPNFISYRNKTFCSAAETDAGSIAAAVADYFAIPVHTDLPLLTQLNNNNGVTLSGKDAAVNTATLGGDPNTVITITVTDGSGRCPADYQRAASVDATNLENGWDGSNVYTKYMSQ